jgi:hypothetical protein
VTLALVLSATVSGAAAGAALGALWSVLSAPELTALGAAAVVSAAVALDILGRAIGWPRPMSVGTQVPQAWGRLLAPATAATLYGLRLGVGPLTILNTWRWWAGMVIAASHGPVAAGIAGAAFGALRTVVTASASARVEHGMVQRMDDLRRREIKVRAWLTAVAVVGAVAMLAACSGDAPDEGAAGTTSTAASRSSTTSSSVAPVALDEELAAVLIDEPIAGFTRLAGEAGEEALDLAAAAGEEDDDQAERALLETRGFERGYQRSWERGDEVAVATVYQFDTAASATAYVEDGLITLEGFGAERFTVPEVAGSTGFSQVGEGESGAMVSHGVVFARGNRFFLVFVSGSASGVTADDARALAAAQSTRVETVSPGG